MTTANQPTVNFSVNPYMDLIEISLAARKTPFLLGKPGVGKSSFLQQTAKAGNLLYIDVRLTGMDQTDIMGIPNFIDVLDANGNVIGKRTSYIPNDLFPLQGMGDERRLIKKDKNGNVLYEKDGKTPQMYDGFLINLEEFTSADEAVQAACYQLILDRQVGQHKLMDNVFLVACGNGANDGAIAGKLGTALKSRVITIEVNVDNKSWMQWAASAGIHQYILDYLSWKPELLHKFDPNTDDLSFPCPRTWQMLSDLIEVEGGYTPAVHTLALGTIGKYASEFKNFVDYYSKLPDLKAILKDPANADMPTEIGQVYALTGVIAGALAEDHTNTQRVSDLMDYTQRMAPEMQVVTVANAMRKKRTLMTNKAVSSWIIKNGPRLNAVL